MQSDVVNLWYWVAKIEGVKNQSSFPLNVSVYYFQLFVVGWNVSNNNVYEAFNRFSFMDLCMRNKILTELINYFIFRRSIIFFSFACNVSGLKPSIQFKDWIQLILINHLMIIKGIEYDLLFSMFLKPNISNYKL